MYVLDTDIVTLYLHQQDTDTLLTRRMLSEWKNVWISVITVEQFVVGALKQVNSNPNGPSYTQKCLFGYRLLANLVPDLTNFKILPFDENAMQIYARMSAGQKRNGANDCKIAAIAQAQGHTVVTRNLKHFQSIGIPCEDWTQNES